MDRDGVRVKEIMMRRLLVDFPKLNKNSSADENDKQIKLGYNAEPCEIAKTVELSSKDFWNVSHTLLDYRSDLWERIGGTKDGFIQVVEVKFKRFQWGRPLYINTEGHEYARYVGRERGDIIIDRVDVSKFANSLNYDKIVDMLEVKGYNDYTTV